MERIKIYSQNTQVLEPLVHHITIYLFYILFCVVFKFIIFKPTVYKYQLTRIVQRPMRLIVLAEPQLSIKRCQR